MHVDPKVLGFRGSLDDGVEDRIGERRRSRGRVAESEATALQVLRPEEVRMLREAMREPTCRISALGFKERIAIARDAHDERGLVIPVCTCGELQHTVRKSIMHIPCPYALEEPVARMAHQQLLPAGGSHLDMLGCVADVDIDCLVSATDMIELKRRERDLRRIARIDTADV